MIRVHKPWFVERYPAAEAIAAEIPRPMLALRTRRLVSDICEARGVSVRTAMRAVTMARVRR